MTKLSKRKIKWAVDQVVKHKKKQSPVHTGRLGENVLYIMEVVALYVGGLSGWEVSTRMREFRDVI